MKTPVFPSLALLCGAAAFEAFCAVPAQVTNVAPEPAGLNLRWTGAGQDQFVLQYQDTLADGIWRVRLNKVPCPASSTSGPTRHIEPVAFLPRGVGAAG